MTSNELRGTAPDQKNTRLRVQKARKPPSNFPVVLFLRFGAEATVDFGELAAVFDAVIGQGEGFFFLPGLEV